MFCPGTSTLADGRVLITGGLSDFKATIYNPFNDTWTATTDMTVRRGYHAQLTLADGKAFVFGGSWTEFVGGKIGEVYDPVTRIWTPKPGIGADGSVVTNDAVGPYRSDNHMWLYEATNGMILHAGPAKMMHWLNLTGSGSVTEAG
jgi:galactose oxidase